MKQKTLVPLMALIGLTACVSHQEADRRARAAYVAGQNQASRQWQEQKLPVVILHGPVRNPTIGWEEGLTLSHAIVKADYTGLMNPVLIRVIRGGQVFQELKGIDLLRHEDVLLLAGDVIEITP